MKNKTNTRIIALLLAAVLISCLYVSCLKDGDDTIVIPLPDGKIPYSVISEDLQDSLRYNGFIIHEGINPPNIEGYFRATPFVIDYASDGYVNDFFDMYMGMSGQKPRGLITYEERQRDTIQGKSIYANVIGHDSSFTMYCYQYLSDGSDSVLFWKCKTATVISGVMTSFGIRNYQYSFIMLEREINPDYDSIYEKILVPVNTFRIYKDGDNVATRLSVKPVVE